MNKKTFDALGRLFEAAIRGGLVQSKAKIFKDLEALDYCSKEEITIGGQFPVKVSGYSITMFGHMAYCLECSDRLNEVQTDIQLMKEKEDDELSRV